MPYTTDRWWYILFLFHTEAGRALLTKLALIFWFPAMFLEITFLNLWRVVIGLVGR